MTPTGKTGKICYVEIPAQDIERSASFYQRAFDWNIRQHDDGTTAFDDTTGQVSGMWVLGRPAAQEPGFVISIMVADAHHAVDRIVAAGGEIVRPIDPDGQEIIAWFRDPGGNVLGIYQEAGLAEIEARNATNG